MITEDYISFDTSLLLKEKGFDNECKTYYGKDKHFYHSNFDYNWNDPKGKVALSSAPTLQVAMKWLREVHNIFIQIRYDLPVFFADLYEMNEDKHISIVSCYKTYEEACEAAIKHYLSRFIE